MINFIDIWYIWYIWLSFGSITPWDTASVYLCDCVLACYALYYFITFSKKIHCNKDCNWEGEPNGTPFKLWEKSHGKLNQISTWRKKKDYTASLLQHSTLIDILKHLLLPSYACLTDNWWSCWILAIDVEELYFNKYWWSMLKKWTHTYISVGDIGQIFRKWLLFLKPDIIVTVSEGRCCCSVTNVKYYCWVAEVIYCSWVAEVRDSCRIVSKVSNYCSVPELTDCW